MLRYYYRMKNVFDVLSFCLNLVQVSTLTTIHNHDEEDLEMRRMYDY
jgi:hypothetical protein